MENFISYKEIEDSLSSFQKIKEILISEINNAISAINEYRNNGLTMDAGSYESDLNRIVSKLESEKSQIEADCTLTENYLNKVSSMAERTVDQLVSTYDAVSTFEAMSGIVKRG